MVVSTKNSHQKLSGFKSKQPRAYWQYTPKHSVVTPSHKCLIQEWRIRKMQVHHHSRIQTALTINVQYVITRLILSVFHAWTWQKLGLVLSVKLSIMRSHLPVMHAKKWLSRGQTSSKMHVTTVTAMPHSPCLILM